LEGPPCIPRVFFKDRESHDLYVKVIYKASLIAFLFYLSLCVLSFWFPFIAMVLMTVSWVYWVFTAVVVDSKQKKREE
jgi:hypothetical protein